MSPRLERTGIRDLTFSNWHRTLSNACMAIDVDFAEYCNHCKRVLAVIETARGHHGTIKPTTILKSLAKQAGVDAWLFLYDIVDPDGEHVLAPTMRVQRVHPNAAMETLTLQEAGEVIERIHSEHVCPVC